MGFSSLGLIRKSQLGQFNLLKPMLTSSLLPVLTIEETSFNLSEAKLLNFLKYKMDQFQLGALYTFTF